MKTRSVIFLALGISALLAAGSQAKPSDARKSTDEGVVDLPMQQFKSGQVVVSVSARGQTNLPFVLDTGANMSAITSTTSKQLGYRSDEGVVVKGGADGSTRLLRIEQYEIGRRQFAKLIVAVMDFSQDRFDSPVAGVLGQRFFEDHDVEFDFANKRVRLRPAGAPRAKLPASVAELAFTTDALVLRQSTGTTWPIVQISLDGKTMPALIDTGVNEIVINQEAASKLGINPNQRKSFVSDSLILGSATFTKQKIVISDGPAFDVIGLHDRPAMILGPVALSGSTFDFSFASARLRVRKREVR